MIYEKCKICRRAGEKLFLKGERCFSAKCAMIRKPYPPGQKAKKRRKPPSEYAKELREKQKLRNWYNLEEQQFKNYVKGILSRRGKVKDASNLLIQKLELRLDNTIFRLGFTLSRVKARQMVSHGFFNVNKKPTDIPSYRLKIGDVVSVRKHKEKKKIIKDIKSLIKKQKTLSWLQLDPEKLEGKVVALPNLEEVSPPVEITAIFEFYSR